MSYGRSPYYIYQGEYDDGDRYFCFMDQAVDHYDGQVWATIKFDAMAQFVASMWKHDHPTEIEPPEIDGELGDLIRRGFVVRPDLARNWSTNG